MDKVQISECRFGQLSAVRSISLKYFFVMYMLCEMLAEKATTAINDAIKIAQVYHSSMFVSMFDFLNS